MVVPTARRDFETIVGWIGHRSPQGAARWVAEFRTRRQFAVERPYRSKAAEAEMAGRDVRQILFKTRSGRTYRALFDIAESKVRVLRIRGPSQDLLDPADF